MKELPASLARGLDFLAKLAMGLAMLLLPLTSLPLLSKLMRGTTVAPASIIFIFILTVTWLPVYLLRGGKLPGETKPFLVFVIVALIASAAAYFLPLPPYKEFSIRGAEIDALVALAIGCATYLVVALWHRESRQLRWALWMINIAGVVLLVWSFAQLYFIQFRGGDYPHLMARLQAFFSTRDLLSLAFHTRVGGFTYEPSWLAHMLNVLFLPYWLGATLTGYSVTKKFLHLSMENFLLAGGVVVMYFTISRVGLVAFLLVCAYLIYRLTVYGIRRLQERVRKRSTGARWHLDKWLPAVLIPATLVVFAGAVIGLLFLWAHFDLRTAHLLSLKALPKNLFDFANRVDFAERVVYWSIGWSVFGLHPFLGVGLGNNGFFFSQLMPSIGNRLTEIVTLVNYAVDLPNIKSFWLRLLAETGLAGTSLFVAWQYVLWHAGKFLRTNRSVLLRTLGWMGAFAVIAFLAEGFSIDSFALPYLWVSMGLLTAASAMARREAI